MPTHLLQRCQGVAERALRGFGILARGSGVDRAVRIALCRKLSDVHDRGFVPRVCMAARVDECLQGSIAALENFCLSAAERAVLAAMLQRYRQPLDQFDMG